MRRRISIAAAIISAVVLCAAQCAYIMYNNILNSGNAALIDIVLTYLSVAWLISSNASAILLRLCLFILYRSFPYSACCPAAAVYVFSVALQRLNSL